MKHTMKKLLCMALAIMLLISVVPVFAMADDGFGDDLSPMSEDFDETPAADSYDTFSDEAVVVYGDNDEDESGSGEGGDSMEIYAYLYTANQDKTQFKSVKSYSGKNVNASLTVGDLLKKTEFLGQGVYDSNGISEFQKYTYYVASDDKRVSAEDTVAADSTDLSGPLEDGKYYTFVRVRKQVDVTLKVDGDTVYGEKTIKANTYDVLNLPTVFKNNGLKANNGNYIYMYTREGEDTPLGNNIRVPGDAITIIGHQDLLSNKATNDAEGVGQPGTSGGTSGGSGSNNGGSSNTNNGTSQNLGNGGTGIVNGSNTDRNRFPYDVVLHIYQNNKVDAPVKNIVINDTLASDATVSLSEVKTEVMKHFSAKTSAGIGYAGLYYARGNWVKDYATYNGEYDAITGIDSMRQVSQVDINVMITNATAKTTAKADSSNPKTGDTIFVPFMVMGVTATALAAAYVFGKKRIAR